MENEENQTSQETPLEETSQETVEKETPNKPTEDVDYLSKFKASQTEAIRLKKELDDLKSTKEIPEEEKKVREILSKYEKERESTVLQAVREQDRKLDELGQIHGSFDRDKFKSHLEEYPAYDSEGNIDYEKSYQYFERLQAVPDVPKKKTPSAPRSGDVPHKEAVNLTGKSIWEIAEEAKRTLQE